MIGALHCLSITRKKHLGSARPAITLDSKVARGCIEAVVTCSLANQTNQNTTHKHKARRRSSSQICVSPSERQQSKQPGREPNKKNTKDLPRTQRKNPLCRINFKTCNKRISIHPETRNKRTKLLLREQQKSRLLYTVSCRDFHALHCSENWH